MRLKMGNNLEVSDLDDEELELADELDDFDEEF